jgi:hypothetical protein
MSTTLEKKSLPAWGETQLDAKPARMDLLLARPATRLFYRASRAGYPLLGLPFEVEVDLYPHGFQRVSLVSKPRLWAKVIDALEVQERLADLLQLEQAFIDRYGDCLKEHEPRR